MTESAWGSAEGEEVQLYPTGTPNVYINKVEIPTSKDGLKYLNIEWVIESEDFNGFEINQMIFASSDYVNQKRDQPKYQKWVMQQVNMLKRIFILSGKPVPESMPTPTELQTLRGCHYDVKLGVEKGTGTYPDKARIIDVFPSTFVPEQVHVPAQTQQVQQSENPADEFEDDNVPF